MQSLINTVAGIGVAALCATNGYPWAAFAILSVLALAWTYLADGFRKTSKEWRELYYEEASLRALVVQGEVGE